MSFKPVFLFDTAVAEQPGTTTTELPSIASLLATQGKISETDSVPTEAIIDTEKKEEPNQPVVPNAATATETPSAVQGNSETQPPKAAEPKVETPAIPAQPIVQPTWQEVLKAQQPETVFKELGYDEKVVGISKTLSESPQMVALFEQWISKGDLTPYLKAVATDYSKMDSEQLMRHQLLDEYPNADEATLNALYQRRVVKAYDLNSDDADELADGNRLLDADASKVREQLIIKQQQFLTPKPPEPKAVLTAVDPQESQRQIQKDFIVNNIKESSLTKGVLTTGKFNVGIEGEKFSYEMPKPQEVVELLLDSKKWQSQLFTKQDISDLLIPNVEKQLLLAAIAYDTDGFFKKYNEHLKSLGSAAVIDPMENASASSTKTSSVAAEGKSIAAQMATAGRISN